MSEMDYLDSLIAEEENHNKLNQEKNGKKKNKKIRIIALISAGVAFVGLAIGGICKAISNKFKGSQDNLPNDKDSYVSLDNDKYFTSDKKDTDSDSSVTSDDIIEDLSDKSLSELGVFEKIENDINDTKVEEFKNASDGIDTNEIVEDEDGTLWQSEEEKTKFENNRGKEIIDNKDGTLTEVPDGNGEDIIVETDKQGYEVQDKDGNVVDSGVNSNGVPDGFTLGDNGNYIKNEDVGKYVYSEYDFYSSDGKLIISKGDKMTVEDYEKAKRELLTEPPKTSTEDKTVTDTVETSEVEERGVVNPDGTYTIDGVTYKSKDVYKDCLIHPELYGEYKGVVMLVSEILAPNNNEKSDVEDNNEYQDNSSNNYNNATEESDEGVINPDGTYTIYGVTYKSKTDYYNCLKNPDLYGMYKGVMMLLTDMPYDIYDETSEITSEIYYYGSDVDTSFEYSYETYSSSVQSDYTNEGQQKVLKIR